MGIYGVFIAIAIAIVISILIVGIICVIYLVGQYDPDEFVKPNEGKRKKK